MKGQRVEVESRARRTDRDARESSQDGAGDLKLKCVSMQRSGVDG